MPSLREYLPGVSQQYWRRYNKVITPTGTVTIDPGTTDYGLLPTPINNERGLFGYFTLTSSSTDLVFTVTIDDITKSSAISAISAGGYVGYYNPGVPWLSINGTGTPAVYVVNYGSETLIPFYRNVNVQVSNPTSAPIAISEMSIDAYILGKGFYRELAKVIAGQE
jgi:hypothetical protein